MGAAGDDDTTNVPGPQSEVRMFNGRPTFFVDGNPFAAPLFATYVPTRYYYGQMGRMGCKVFNFAMNCGRCVYGHSKPVWLAEDKWDFTEVDERAQNALADNPDALLLPRIYIDAPDWWRDNNPDEMQVLDHGGKIYREPYNTAVTPPKRTYPSLASAKYREAMAGALKKTIRHMLDASYGGHIMGFEIAGLATEEWYHWSVNQEQLADYSPHIKAAFREWLRRKYATDEALRKAWNSTTATLATAEIPAKIERFGNRKATFRDPAREMNVIDYYVFYNDIVAGTIDFFAGAAKETTGRNKVIGAFYDYLFEFHGNTEFGHYPQAGLLDSRNIDFICAPPSYNQRQLGSGAECYRRPFLSGTLHGKLWFHDNDLSSFLFPKVMAKHHAKPAEIENMMKVLAVTTTAQESIWLFERSAGFVMCEGIYESYFDLHGGYFDDPRLLNSLAVNSAALTRSPEYDRSTIAEILVVADGVSCSYNSFQAELAGEAHANRINEALADHQIGFIKCGAPYDSVLLADLKLVNPDQYKVVVFLNTFNMDDAARTLVNGRLKGNNRVLVWCYAPGLFNGYKESQSMMMELTGIHTVGPRRDGYVCPKTVLTQAGRDFVESQGQKPPAAAFGLEGKICDLVKVEDPMTMTLGVLAETSAPVMAMRKFNGWTSVYSMTQIMPPEVVRAIAKSAGVHLFNDRNDTLYANKSFITINGDGPGSRTVRLPRRASVWDALRNIPLHQNVDSFEISLMHGETQVYRYGDK
ncbi:MAG: beta-galactosidase [bacterium]|nr:beta-galactosidase [Candidatus Sumerlaeota bacterium]